MSEEKKSCFDEIEHLNNFLENNDSEKWTEKIEELYRFLRGEKIECVVHKFKPKLSRSNAEFIIWFLQEVTGIIPQQFEFCGKCDGEVYDSHRGGHYSEILRKGFCDYHAYECDILAFCYDCGNEVSKKQYSKRFEEYLCDKCRKKRMFLKGITKDKIKSFCLELFTYLRDHPGKKGRKNIPESINEKLEFLDKKCPLCKIFLPEDFDRYEADDKENCDCNGCPLGNYGNCPWRKIWMNATSEKTRHKYTEKIIELIEKWNVMDDKK
jgi:hypothetical protein